MKRKPKNQKNFRALLALLGAATGINSQAGEVFFDFNTQPPAGLFTTFGTQGFPEWRPSGGVNDSGYYAITDAWNSLNATLVFPDIDDGKVIKGFEFSVDVRIGDGTGNPADGFSINYARAGDPVLTTGAGYVAGAMEEGTTTGLAISFDTYDNGGGDVVGISVRVDGQIVFSKPYPTRNGQIGDLTSLQTGPRGDGSGSSLAWEPFTVKLTEAGSLTITYKNAPVVTDLQTSFFPSPGRMVFAARTGGENEMHHIDNLRLKTVPATSPTLGLVVGQPSGFIIPIDDAGSIQPRPDSVTATLNGTAVTPVVTRSGKQTFVSYTMPGNFFPAGSQQEVTIAFTDTAGAAVTETRSFTVPNYSLVGSAWRTTNFDATSSGFNVRISQIAGSRYPGDENSIAAAETQLAGGMIDPFTGQPYDNIADLSQADPQTGLFVVPTINWDQNGTDIDPNNPDNFNSVEPTEKPVPNEPIPGIWPGDQNNIAAAITTCLELKQGTHILGVNSDDGFLLTLGHSPLGPVLGSYNGGRGASDSLMTIAVEQDGVYPVRLSWWEGVGGANVEFFSVNAATGERILINDRSNPRAIKAYNVCRGPAFVKSLLPANGAIGVSVRPTIKAVLQDSLTAVDDNSIRILLNGQPLTTTVSNNGAEPTVTATPASNLEYLSTQTGQIIFSAGNVTTTNTFSFRVAAGGFAIEAEDFDYGAGQFVPTVDQNPYSGGAYFGLDAVHMVDYFQSYNEPAGDNYRWNEFPNVPMGGNNDLADRERPGFVVDNGQNWSIGWAGGGEWYNYTRTLTNGNYKIIMAQSHGDAAGLPDRLIASVGIVTDGVGTDQQSVVRIGSYSAPSSGGWGNNVITTLQTGGQDTVVRLGGRTTIRVFIDSGDFDWFALVPTAQRTSPPYLESRTPTTPQRSIDTATFRLSHQFRDTTIDASSVRLAINGTDVSSGLQVASNPGGVEVTYNRSGGLPVGESKFELTFRNNEGTTFTETGSFVVIGQENFVIEAEDYNYNSGQTVAQASVMPLTAGLYAGLVGVHDVDYHVNQDEPSGNEYRLEESPNVPTPATNGDLNRGSFDLESNYRIGWVDAGEWWNYTRSFPAGDYNVYAALSKDGGTMGGRLALVQNATSANQTVTEVGTFRAPASGAWARNNYVALRTADGSLATLNVSGTQTVRFTSDFGAGDFDHLVFVKVEGASQPAITISKGTNGQVTISWTGGGTLQSTTELGPNAQWNDVSSSGSVTVNATAAQQFYRVRR